jgi:hypothetical protein
MYLPLEFSFAGPAVDSIRLGARVAAIFADQAADTCAPLIDWLRTAYHIRPDQA